MVLVLLLVISFFFFSLIRFMHAFNAFGEFLSDDFARLRRAVC